MYLLQLPPPSPLTQIEKDKLDRVKRNNHVLDDLGVKRMIADLNVPTAPKSNGKQKVQAECNDYIPENEMKMTVMIQPRYDDSGQTV